MPFYPAVVDALAMAHDRYSKSGNVYELIGICIRQWAGSSRNVSLSAAVQIANTVMRSFLYNVSVRNRGA